MADEMSARLGLPLLATAQAQKEMTHNEALVLAELAIQAVVVAVAPTSVPAAPTPGQCWIVGAGASGAWSGRDGAIAGWTSGGWRFLSPSEGMTAWSIADGTTVRRTASGWAVGELRGARVIVGGQQVVGARQAAVAAPNGGAVVDAEARAALGAVLAVLRAHGLIAN